MARPRKFDYEEAIRLHAKYKNGELSYADIAGQLGVAVSTLQNFYRRRGLSEKYVSHKDVIPWTLADEHSGAVPAKRLRSLSRLAQGFRLGEDDITHQEQTNTAISWANELLDKGLDVDYRRDEPPSEFCPQGGFYTKKANPDDYLLGRLMVRVRAALTRKL